MLIRQIRLSHWIRQLTITSNVMVTSRSSTNLHVLPSNHRDGCLKMPANSLVWLLLLSATWPRMCIYALDLSTKATGSISLSSLSQRTAMCVNQHGYTSLWRESDYKYWQQLSIYVLLLTHLGSVQFVSPFDSGGMWLWVMQQTSERTNEKKKLLTIIYVDRYIVERSAYGQLPFEV